MTMAPSITIGNQKTTHLLNQTGANDREDNRIPRSGNIYSMGMKKPVFGRKILWVQ